jgi:thioredoxin reductase
MDLNRCGFWRHEARGRGDKFRLYLYVERAWLESTVRIIVPIFAVGDVRGGNITRVASAVGEGSIAIAFVHQVLQQ